MDTIQPLMAMVPDRPLLGVCVLMTCLAGGSATQNLAVVPHKVDRIDYAFDASIKLPAIPAVALAADPTPRALAPLPKFRQFRSFDQIAPVPVEAELAATIQRAEPAPRSAAAALPQSGPVEASLVIAESKPALALSEAAPITALQPAVAAEAALIAPRTAAAFDTAFAAIGAPAPEAHGVEPAPALAPATASPTIANPAGLRGFDLARVVPAAARKPAALVAPRAAMKPSSAAPKPRTAGARDRIMDATVFHPTTIMIAGQSAGQVDVRIGADMKPSIKVGDLLAMVSAQMDPELAGQLSAASGASDYVSFAMLRDAGFKVSYNAGADSVSIGVAD